jgi:peptide/nickel transport system substrate-binding protein
MKLRRCNISISLVLLALLPACAADDGSAPGDEGDGQPVKGGTVTILELADIDKPLPMLETTELDGEITEQLYMSLLAGHWVNGALEYWAADRDPRAIAKSYELFGADSASLRYHMRGDLVWSDGTPLTANDVKWTLETMADPKVASPRQDYAQNFRSIEVENDSTVVIHFTKRYPEMLFHTTAVGVVPSHLFAGTDLSQMRSHPALTNPAGGALVVSGPYIIGEWVPNQRVVLVPNPRYQPSANIERVVFLTIPDESARLVELQTGRGDMMRLPFDKLEMVRAANPEVRFETRQRRAYDYIAYNPRAHPALADPEIRRALGQAIDVQALIGALDLTEYAEPAAGPYAPIFKKLYDPQALPPLAFDSAAAKRTLDQKGWVPGPDGIRARQGRRLSFTLSTNAGNQRRADIMQIVQQQWRQIGVEANLQTLEPNTFFERLQRRDYDAAVAGWSVGLAPDISDQWRGDNVFNYTSFDKPEVSRLFDQALSQPTEDAAAPYWRQAAAGIVAEQPYTWLFYMDIVYGVNDRVKGTRIDTYGHYQNLHEWWIPLAYQNAAGDAASR